MGQTNSSPQPRHSSSRASNRPYQGGHAQGGARVQPKPQFKPKQPVQHQQKRSPTRPAAAPQPNQLNDPGLSRNGLSAYDQRIVQALDQASVSNKLDGLVSSTKIQLDSTGHTYETLFSPYMSNQLTVIRIDEPYTSKHHQLVNIVRFLECCVAHCPALRVIKLVTREGEDPAKQRSAFTDLQSSMKRHGIAFLVEYETRVRDGIHDRSILFNTGYLIQIGRGLDLYQKVDLSYYVGMIDYSLRKCKQTSVEVFKYSC